MFIFVIILFLFCINLYGQARQEFWSKITVNQKISKCWTIGGDVQYRSQANPNSQIRQPFAEDLLYGIRLTTFYQVSEQYKVYFVFSPFLYFRSSEFTTSGSRKEIHEYRFTLGILQKTEIKGIKISNRGLYEMRFLHLFSPYTTQQHRVRWQLQAIVPLFSISSDRNKEWRVNYMVFNEIFAAKPIESTFQIDQNRFCNALQLSYKFIELNTGLQKTIQKVKPIYQWRNQWYFSALFSLN
ncbi:MAG: DUF2490 domain-containing protein [Microscillaceae bacterium]|nr:DUF2490 domain-containing protein [Microscillaceae bacterium]MDW8461424.1 DUF2490 domain-containing protein [Cytophagales bacterium]